MDLKIMLAALLLAAAAVPSPALEQDQSTYPGGHLPGYNEPARDQKVPSSDAEDHREKVKTLRHRKAGRNGDRNEPARAEPPRPGTGDIPEKTVKPGTTGSDTHELDENRGPAANPPAGDTRKETEEGNYR
jgi:hypothetical protein